MSFLSEDIDEMNRVFIIHGSFGVLCSVLYIFEKMAYRMSRGEYFNATYVRVTRVLACWGSSNPPGVRLSAWWAA